jgi:hypothetical protein
MTMLHKAGNLPLPAKIFHKAGIGQRILATNAMLVMSRSKLPRILLGELTKHSEQRHGIRSTGTGYENLGPFWQ